MKHTVIYKREGYYCSFPQLDHLPDGRLAVVVPVSSVRDHTVVWSSEACDEWVVLVSTDEGETWEETDDPTVPYNWPTGLPRARKSGCSAAVMPDGSYVITGAEPWQLWAADRRPEAEEQGRSVRAHPVDDGAILVGGQEMFSQRSTDGGRTWIGAGASGSSRASGASTFSRRALDQMMGRSCSQCTDHTPEATHATMFGVRRTAAGRGD